MHHLLQLHFFEFNSFVNQFWAFTQMQLAHAKLKKVEGLTFYKLLGTGGGDGFQWYPDFSRYALLVQFDTDVNAAKFSKSRVYQQYLSKSIEHCSFGLHTYEAHGFWSGQQPFKVYDYQENQPIAVITRARIKWKYLFKFWYFVPKTSGSLSNYDGRYMGKGLGEWPLIQQATFSIWESQDKMMAYAYKNPKHREVIKKTRQLGWYSEELFARFHVLEMSGTWQGNHWDFLD